MMPIINKSGQPGKPTAKPATPPTNEPPKELTDAEKTIAEIKAIKDTMVPKTELDRITAERDKFRSALIQGAAMEEEEPVQSAEELAKTMAGYNSGNVTNLQYITTALKLREATIEEKGIDPFESAESPDGFGERVAQGLQRMVDEADGRPEAFLGIYQASVRDEKVLKPQ